MRKLTWLVLIRAVKRGRIMGIDLGENIRVAPCNVRTAFGIAVEDVADMKLAIGPRKIKEMIIH